MEKRTSTPRHKLARKLILSIVAITLMALMGGVLIGMQHQKASAMRNVIREAGRLSGTVKLTTRYAMMHNAKDLFTPMMQGFEKSENLESLRIYNKAGQVRYATTPSENEPTATLTSDACAVCHNLNPPLKTLDMKDGILIRTPSNGPRYMELIIPIHNEPGCSASPCHVHPTGQTVLGIMEIKISLEETDQAILLFRRKIILSTGLLFLLFNTFLCVFIMKWINRPLARLMKEVRSIGKDTYTKGTGVYTDDEMGQLAAAIDEMAREIEESRAELKKQRNEYQNLFEQVPCIITVQDRDYKLISYNREFAEKFDPKTGDHCYHAYKGRDEKCVICPVEKTFEDGQSHMSEETGFSKDGTLTHWIVKTTPVKNEAGETIAAMEMNVDITQIKQLEAELRQSEKKYYEIFNNIPNPVFVLDIDDLTILDCNDSVMSVYGFNRDEIVRKPFLDLFNPDERAVFSSRLRSDTLINHAKQIDKTGNVLYVNIRISPSEYHDQKVLLVTTSDITKLLEAEQQLVQASKMATLGEMATGVAHELNQPLSVIKTASNFLMKKITKKEKIEDHILFDLSKEMDSHVDRATKIISHMRQFGRKSDMVSERIQVNEILQRAFDIFSQQLKVRGIGIEWLIDPSLPEIMADAQQLEQVFINLLINARDAIEEKAETGPDPGVEKKITLKTASTEDAVIIEVCDTGTGIPDAIKEKIFDPFFTTKSAGKGTGLGLSISYGIVQNHNGTIKAISRDPHGTCFILTFPVAGAH